MEEIRKENADMRKILTNINKVHSKSCPHFDKVFAEYKAREVAIIKAEIKLRKQEKTIFELQKHNQSLRESSHERKQSAPSASIYKTEMYSSPGPSRNLSFYQGRLTSAKKNLFVKTKLNSSMTLPNHKMNTGQLDHLQKTLQILLADRKRLQNDLANYGNEKTEKSSVSPKKKEEIEYELTLLEQTIERIKQKLREYGID